MPIDSKGGQEEFEAVNAVKFLPMREEKIQEIRHETDRDETLQLLKATILQRWPDDKSNIPTQLTP